MPVVGPVCPYRTAIPNHGPFLISVEFPISKRKDTVATSFRTSDLGLDTWRGTIGHGLIEEYICPGKFQYDEILLEGLGRLMGKEQRVQ